MKTYIVESFVNRPLVILANTINDAKNEYIHKIGYDDFEAFIQEVGLRFGVIDAEELFNANSDKNPKTTH